MESPPVKFKNLPPIFNNSTSYTTTSIRNNQAIYNMGSVTIMYNCENQNFGHNFCGGFCSQCKISQDELNRKFAEKKIKQPKEYKIPERNNNLHSELHYWVNEICDYFDERKKFGMWIGIIKKVGIPKARELLSEFRQWKLRDPKLFMFRCSEKCRF